MSFFVRGKQNPLIAAADYAETANVMRTAQDREIICSAWRVDRHFLDYLWQHHKDIVFDWIVHPGEKSETTAYVLTHFLRLGIIHDSDTLLNLIESGHLTDMHITQVLECVARCVPDSKTFAALQAHCPMTAYKLAFHYPDKFSKMLAQAPKFDMGLPEERETIVVMSWVFGDTGGDYHSAHALCMQLRARYPKAEILLWLHPNKVTEERIAKLEASSAFPIRWLGTDCDLRKDPTLQSCKAAIIFPSNAFFASRLGMQYGSAALLKSLNAVRLSQGLAPVMAIHEFSLYFSSLATQFPDALTVIAQTGLAPNLGLPMSVEEKVAPPSQRATQLADKLKEINANGFYIGYTNFEGWSSLVAKGSVANFIRTMVRYHQLQHPEETAPYTIPFVLNFEEREIRENLDAFAAMGIKEIQIQSDAGITTIPTGAKDGTISVYIADYTEHRFSKSDFTYLRSCAHMPTLSTGDRSVIESMFQGFPFYQIMTWKSSWYQQLLNLIEKECGQQSAYWQAFAMMGEVVDFNDEALAKLLCDQRLPAQIKVVSAALSEQCVDLAERLATCFDCPRLVGVPKPAISPEDLSYPFNELAYHFGKLAQIYDSDGPPECAARAALECYTLTTTDEMKLNMLMILTRALVSQGQYQQALDHLKQFSESFSHHDSKLTLMAQTREMRLRIYLRRGDFVGAKAELVTLASQISLDDETAYYYDDKRRDNAFPIYMNMRCIYRIYELVASNSPETLLELTTGTSFQERVFTHVLLEALCANAEADAPIAQCAALFPPKVKEGLAAGDYITQTVTDKLTDLVMKEDIQQIDADCALFYLYYTLKHPMMFLTDAPSELSIIREDALAHPDQLKPFIHISHAQKCLACLQAKHVISDEDAVALRTELASVLSKTSGLIIHQTWQYLLLDEQPQLDRMRESLQEIRARFGDATFNQALYDCTRKLTQLISQPPDKPSHDNRRSILLQVARELTQETFTDLSAVYRYAQEHMQEEKEDESAPKVNQTFGVNGAGGLY